MSALDDLDIGDLWERSQGLIIPGAAGAAAGAGLGTYLTSQRKRGESPSDRRSRVIRNALIGATMGGVTGTTLPAGMNLLSEAGESGIGDTMKDLVANTIILGSGAGLGYAGGQYVGNKWMRTDVDIENQGKIKADMYSRLAQSGKRSESIKAFIVPVAPDGKGPQRADQLNAVGDAADANPKIFFEDLKESKYKELLKDFDGTPNAREMAMLKLDADDWTRLKIKDAGINLPDDTISASFKRLFDPNLWSGRAESVKKLLGLRGAGAAGKTWGKVPVTSSRARSVLRRAVKTGLPGFGMAAGGLIASQFI